MSTAFLSDRELVDSMVEVANAAGDSKWPRQFAHSMIKQANRKDWHPTAKQRAMMRRMVFQMHNDADCSDVIDFGDDFTQEVPADAQGELILTRH